MALTKSEIRYKICYLENEKIKLEIKIKHYEEAISAAIKMSGNLKSCQSNLKSALNGIESSFKINGKTADNGKINDLVADINNILSNLDGNVISNINKCISELNNEIKTISNNIYYWYRQLEIAEE